MTTSMHKIRNVTISRGLNPISISKMSIGKKYMWISAAPDVKHNIRCDWNCQSQGKFSTFKQLYKIQSFFWENRNVILPSWLSSILPIFVLDFYAVLIEIFFPSCFLVCPKHAMCIKKISLYGLKNRAFFEISQQTDASHSDNSWFKHLLRFASNEGIAFELHMYREDPYLYDKIIRNIITDHFHEAIYNLFLCVSFCDKNYYQK
jgi:hypothetical protein